jgi:hypothetical protein
MTERPALGRGLFSTRDSGGEHENTPGECVRWVQQEPMRLGVVFTWSPENIEAMIRDGRSQDGDLFLDHVVKGAQLQRASLDALCRIA